MKMLSVYPVRFTLLARFWKKKCLAKWTTPFGKWEDNSNGRWGGGTKVVPYAIHPSFSRSWLSYVSRKNSPKTTIRGIGNGFGSSSDARGSCVREGIFIRQHPCTPIQVIIYLCHVLTSLGVERLCGEKSVFNLYLTSVMIPSHGGAPNFGP